MKQTRSACAGLQWAPNPANHEGTNMGPDVKRKRQGPKRLTLMPRWRAQHLGESGGKEDAGPRKIKNGSEYRGKAKRSKQPTSKRNKNCCRSQSWSLYSPPLPRQQSKWCVCPAEERAGAGRVSPAGLPSKAESRHSAQRFKNQLHPPHWTGSSVKSRTAL